LPNANPGRQQKNPQKANSEINQPALNSALGNNPPSSYNANPPPRQKTASTSTVVLPTETTNEFLPQLEKYRRDVQQNPKDPDARDYLGNALREAGEVDAAIEQFQVAVKLPPKNIGRGYLYRDLGEAFEKKGDYEGALEAMRKSVTLWPVKNDPVYCRLPFEQGAIGRILEEKGDYAGAMEYWRSLVSVAKDPDECQRQAERLAAKVKHVKE
jgi:tetratricopeptide (TPR) repeat protein